MLNDNSKCKYDYKISSFLIVTPYEIVQNSWSTLRKHNTPEIIKITISIMLIVCIYIYKISHISI
jgi:hypothetical protein